MAGVMKISIMLLAGALSSAAVAGSAVVPAPDPRDPRAIVPPLQYESVLRGRSIPREVPLVRWRDANVNVGTLRGHAGHVKDTDPAPLPPADPGVKP